MNRYLVILLAGVLITLLYLQIRAQRLIERNSSPKLVDNSVSSTPNLNCVPTFVDGGGPYYLPNAPFRSKLDSVSANGEKLTVKGRVLRNDCKTSVSDATLDVWHASAKGEYENEWYRGKIKTNSAGDYEFETVVPKGYGEGTGQRPPHIHFKVLENDREIITSQMFFPEVRGRAGFDDAYIMKLVTKEENGKPVHFGYHDIILP